MNIEDFMGKYSWGSKDCIRLADALIEWKTLNPSFYRVLFSMTEQEALKYAIKNYGSAGGMHDHVLKQSGMTVVEGDVQPYDLIWANEGSIGDHVLDDNHKGVLAPVWTDYNMYGYYNGFLSSFYIESFRIYRWA